MLRTIIIDDEEHQRLTILKMVKLYCPKVTVVAQADGVKTGVEAIRKFKPDLVLLDIKLQDGTGFDILEEIKPVDFKVIFITAYNQFAIKAFRFSALDYLLKPLDPDELVQAVSKIRDVMQKDFNNQLENLREHLITDDSVHKRIVVKTFDSIHLIPVKDILFCQSNNNYVTINLLCQKQIIASCTLKDFEEMLSESGFFRVHKSFLVNMKHVQRFDKAEGGSLFVEGGHQIPVSSRKREEIIEIFSRLPHV
jgi:two-component system LytT family response regulator